MGQKLKTVGALAKTGILRPVRPDKFLKMGAAAKKFGSSPATIIAMAAHRYPKRTAIIDAKGQLTWGEVDRRTNRIVRALRSDGIDSDQVMGILCRNHRGFVEALTVAGKLGTDAVLLNTGFSGPQLGEVARREGVTLLVHDDSFAAEVAESGLAAEIPTYRTWTDPGSDSDRPSFDVLAESGDAGHVDAPSSHSAIVILSSGTTGTPKGAKRSIDREKAKAGMQANLAVVTRIPVKSGAPTLIAAPLFHTWGFTNLLVAGFMAAPMVLRERFDPADVVESLARERVRTLVAVPAMLQRILDLPVAERSKHNTSSLKVVALSGSALPGGLATRWMDAFGDNIYSLYGSTEVAAVAIADPSDLRAAPDTAGPPLDAIDLRLLDAEGKEVPRGETGRIFVRSGMLFDGYTSGDNKEVLDGYMNTGDLGHLDENGRLFIDGREDDMIVSGGENVYPAEVEDALFSHEAVEEAAVVGEPHEEWGETIAAYVVATEDLSASDLDAFVVDSDRLADFKRPRRYYFVDELPKNPSGKIQKFKLRDDEADVESEVETITS